MRGVVVALGLAATAACATVTAASAARLDYTVEVVTDAVNQPWAIAFLPDGTMLVTEKSGSLRRVTREGVVSAPISNVPAVDADGQGGLLDVAVHPEFASNRLIFFTYARNVNGTTGTALARATLSADFKSLSGVRVLFTQFPRYDGAGHFGGRIVLDGNGHVFVSLGDRQRYPDDDAAQRLTNTVGKVIRLTETGGIPADNPFAAETGPKRAIWTYGHRNPQGLALDPANGDLIEMEHGPLGGDELNILKPGANYGWPAVSWGRNYDGTPVGTGKTSAVGMEDSIFHWDPVIAPSGIAFYNSNVAPAWKGNLFVAGLASTALVRLTIKNRRVLSEERLLTERGQRLRDVAVGPDGFLYVATDASPGEILKVSPTP